MVLKKSKKITCAVLCSAIVITGTGTAFPGNAADASAAGGNILDNPSFGTSTDGWFVTTAGNAVLEFINDGKGYDQEGGYVKVTGRSDTWNSLAQDIKDKVTNNTKYNVSCWVKLGDEYTAESTVKAGLTIQSTGDNDGEPFYDDWGIYGSEVTASKDEWRQISGSFTTNWTGDLKDLQFKVADETGTNSFYVDALSVTENNAGSYSITYNLDGGTNHADNPESYSAVQEVTFKDPSKPGYIFKGWYKDSGFTEQVSSINAETTGDITLYAKWEKEPGTPSGTAGPDNTANPTPTPAPTPTPVPEPTKKPVVIWNPYLPVPVTTPVPEVTEVPQATATPEVTEAPQATPIPTMVPASTPTPVPTSTAAPVPIPTPAVTPVPQGTPAPDNTQIPSATVTPGQTPDTSKEDNKKKTMSVSGITAKTGKKKVAGTLSVEGTKVQVKVGNKKYKSAKVNGKKFTFTASSKLKKGIKVTIKVTKPGYNTITKSVKVK